MDQRGLAVGKSGNGGRKWDRWRISKKPGFKRGRRNNGLAVEVRSWGHICPNPGSLMGGLKRKNSPPEMTVVVEVIS